MSDPWERAARDHTARSDALSQRAAADRAAAGRVAAQRDAARRRAREQTEREITQATPQLEALLRSRGEAARRLLAAVNRGQTPGRFVLFGCDRQGGGSYVSVIFNQNGLQRVIGQGGGYTQPDEKLTPTTAREAVSYAVYYGGKKAAEVTCWFKQQLDTIAAQIRR